MKLVFTSLALLSLFRGLETIEAIDEQPFQSGQLTAGDIDDNLNFAHYLAYKDRAGQNNTAIATLASQYDLSTRVAIQVKDANGDPFSCAIVNVGNQELPASTNGRLWVFPSMDDVSTDPSTWNLVARAPEGTCPNDCSEKYTGSSSTTTRSAASDVQLQIPQVVSSLPDKLDLALIVDTTGSMCDELGYLQTELKSVVESVVRATSSDGNPNVDVRVSIVLYRDTGDAYVVQTTPFTTVDIAVAAFVSETCGGGGDYPEAMDQAISAAKELDWRSGNVARVAFIVADAPPHDLNLVDTLESALGLRRLGVRLYGLAASGVADTAEYLMRLMSMVTGARYTWLTDDSGFGESHAEPKVVCYQVSRLDQLLIRILKSELLGTRVEAEESEIIRETGTQYQGVCIVDVDPQPPDEDIPIVIGVDGAPEMYADATRMGSSSGSSSHLNSHAGSWASSFAFSALAFYLTALVM